jgi:hypothetical protein
LQLANKSIQGKGVEEIRGELNEYLSSEIAGITSRRKTRDILMQCWVNPSPSLENVRKHALSAYKVSSSNRYLLQYCILLAAYPVISDMCAMIGKLSTMQNEFSSPWLEKIYEAWGERPTLDDTLKYGLQSLIDIGVLVRPKIGKYQIVVRTVEPLEYINVLLMTILSIKGMSYCELSELKTVSQMFPFEFSVPLEWLHNSQYYHLNNYGGKMTVSLKE